MRNVIKFSVYADSPYRPADTPFIQEHLMIDRSNPKLDFIVHLGDIVDDFKNGKLPASYLDSFRELIIGGSSKPTFVCLGDNECNDLRNPARALSDWANAIDVPVNAQHCSQVKVQWKFRRPKDADALPGLFRFELLDVVFMSLVVPGVRFNGGDSFSAAERKRFRQKNLAWLSECSEEARDRLLVIFSHAWPWNVASGIATEAEAEQWRADIRKLINCLSLRPLMIFGDTHEYWPLKSHDYFRVNTISAPRTTMEKFCRPPLRMQIDTAGSVEVSRRPRRP